MPTRITPNTELFTQCILIFFVALFEFSLAMFQLFSIYELKDFLTSVYRVPANSFRKGSGNSVGNQTIYFIILNFLIEIHVSILVFLPLSTDIFLLNSQIIFLKSGALYGILRMLSLFLHPRKRTLKLYYNTTFRRTCVTISNQKLRLLCFFPYLNPQRVLGIQNKTLLHVLPSHHCSFSGDDLR